mmetsp:Transcript_89933/g.143097  ORF Transcript_89933/g.143097 Transcript_89933/m.143097 type:complete len:230 (+) Transcript_89933:46-735(+)
MFVTCCRCTEGADGGTEASADDEVLPISAVLTAGGIAKGSIGAEAAKSDETRMAESSKKLHACARSLRSRIDKDKQEVWKKTAAEFEVQKMIWQSLSMKGGEKLKGIAAMIESKVEYAIASHTKDLNSAIEALDACLEKNKGHDLLSAAMSEAIEEIKNCPKTLAMQELATLLDSAAEELASNTKSRGATEFHDPLQRSGLQPDGKLGWAIRCAWSAAYHDAASPGGPN